MPKIAITLDDPDVVRQFVNGPCARQARILLEEAGIFSIHCEEFDEAIASIEQDLADEAQVQSVIRTLLNSPGPIAPDETLSLGQNLDRAHVASLMRRSEVAYLLGLAVGRMIGGTR